MNKSFIVYESFLNAILKMPERLHGVAYTALMKYGLYGEIYTGDMYVEIFMEGAMPVIDSAQKRRKGGSKGGRPKKETIGLQSENHRLLHQETIGLQSENHRLLHQETIGLQSENHRLGGCETLPIYDNGDVDVDGDGDGELAREENHHRPRSESDLPDPQLYDPEFKKAMDCYLANVSNGVPPGAKVTESIGEWVDKFGGDVVCCAIEQKAVDTAKGRLSWKLVQLRLDDYANNGITTAEQAKHYSWEKKQPEEYRPELEQWEEIDWKNQPRIKGNMEIFEEREKLEAEERARKRAKIDAGTKKAT